MNKYSAFVLDDDEQVRNLLLECLRFSNFEAHGCSEAEKLLSAIYDTRLPLEDLPDLIVVDLQLQPSRMQGIELVSELTERNIPSEILAISGNLPPGDLVEAIKVGASDAIPKPFDIFELVKKMELLAGIGMKRRLYRLGLEDKMDESRLRRPVFLSYANQDRVTANGLRRNMEAKDIAVCALPVCPAARLTCAFPLPSSETAATAPGPGAPGRDSNTGPQCRQSSSVDDRRKE
jgi:DNA-binding response OmpR family regulator